MAVVEIFMRYYKILSFASLALLFMGAFFFHDEYLLSSPKTVENCIQKMLPKEESLVSIEPLQGGFMNTIWQVYTSKGRYILREKAGKVSASAFLKDIEMAKKASEYGIGPEVIGINVRRQQILLEYIEHVEWPKFTKNSEPYKKAMLALKIFHEKMPASRRFDKSDSYAPFSYIFYKGKLMKEKLPMEFSLALEKLEAILEELTPWLKEHAVLCHGDFCKANVLLSKDLSPHLIDFDSASIGDPLLDVVKFSLNLSKEARLELFRTYLGISSLSEKEIRHFEMMDLSILMLITTCRFDAAQKLSSEEKLSTFEMERILRSKEPLPSFREVSFKINSAKTKQLAALFALSEFLKRSETFDP
jgi:aminoglycoside phosphotransferase (APT) family kinase protein